MSPATYLRASRFRDRPTLLPAPSIESISASMPGTRIVTSMWRIRPVELRTGRRHGVAVGTAYPTCGLRRTTSALGMTTETNSATRPDLPMTRPARLAAARRKKATQTREWRATRIAMGWPESRQVDAAISEALSFCTRPEFRLRDDFGETWLSLDRIFRVAILVLMRDGADRDLSQDAVRERLHPPSRHQAGAVPSIQMREEGYTPPPRRKDADWDEIDLRAMKAAATLPMGTVRGSPIGAPWIGRGRLGRSCRRCSRHHAGPGGFCWAKTVR